MLPFVLSLSKGRLKRYERKFYLHKKGSAMLPQAIDPRGRIGQEEL